MKTWSGLKWRVKALWRDIRFASTLIGQPPQEAKAERLQWFGASILEDAHEAVEASGLPAFLAFGTLLGAIREGAHIKGDRDLDLAVLPGHDAELACFLKHMTRKGYHLLVPDARHPYRALRLESTRKGLVGLDVYQFHASLESYYVTVGDGGGNPIKYTFPQKVLEPLSRKCLHGRLWRVPHHAEAFLERHYGDWRVPDPDWDHRTDAKSRVPQPDRRGR